MAGLLSVLLFSHLFGMGFCGRNCWGEDYNRTVKIWWKKVASCSAIHSCLISVIFGIAIRLKYHVIPTSIKVTY